MSSNGIGQQEQFAGKAAGATLLLTLATGLGAHLFIWSRLHVKDNVIATASMIMANETLFRLGIVADLLAAAIVFMSGCAFYMALKREGHGWALLALSAKIVESALVGFIAMAGFISLWMVKAKPYMAAFEPEQIQSLIGLSMDIHFSIYALPMVFAGIGDTLFFWLLFKSRYIPRPLALLGMLAYFLIFTYCVTSLLAPAIASKAIFQMVCFTPSMLTELLAGSWLLAYGLGGGHREEESMERSHAGS